MLALTVILGVSCDKVPVEYIEYTPGEVVVLMVDYTTNRFMGGYTVPVEFIGGDFGLEADYNSPGDFGDVTIYEKETGTKLFAGDIIWMGRGERTFPEEILPAKEFARTSKSSSPELERFYPVENGWTDGDDDEINKVWKSVKNLDIVHQAIENAPNTDVYMYLYRRSVGVGDPADWYWLIFIRG